MARCYDQNNVGYPVYGGRGVKVCERWHSYIEFVADMGLRPQGKTLDRKDSDGNYEASNCRWATQKEQQNNRRNNHVITYRGKTQTLTMWAEEIGFPYETLLSRIRRNWPLEIAMTKKRRGY
jgi:hypothetical protein